MKFHPIIKVLLFIFGMTKTASTARILGIPQNVNSHVIYYSRLAKASVEQGHQFTMILASNAKVPNFIETTNIPIIRYDVKDPVPYMNTKECSNLFLEASLGESMFERYRTMMKVGMSLVRAWHEDCESMLESKTVRAHMEHNKYDLALGDNTALDCQFVLPMLHDIPIIIVGVMYFEFVYRVPALRSFAPHMMSPFSDEMTFVERIQNTMLYGMSKLMVPNNLTYYDKYLPSKNVKDVLDGFRNSVLYFVLDDPVLAYPRPIMPNLHYVGDLIPQPPKTLPPNILDFVENASDGVVIVSFGSFFDYPPKDVAAKFCRALQRLPQRVIWKLKNSELCSVNPDKMLILDWLPQNDLLGHPNVKLFISHCGMNSILESVYHGTPVLGVPISIDQPYNAIRVQNRGYGLRMSLQGFTEDELVSKVSEIINSKVITENVQQASRIMRNRPISAAKHMSYLVHHVAQYGDKHLRTAAFKLNDLQFYMLDVFLAITVIAITLLVVLTALLCLCCRCTLRLLGRCCYRSTKTKKD